MSFSVSRRGDVCDVSVEGQLVASNRQELKQAVLAELDAGARRFLIDFERTGYIDSAGLGILVSLSKRIREHRGELRLTRLNDDLHTLFHLTKLDTLFVVEGRGDTDREPPAGRTADLPPKRTGPIVGQESIEPPATENPD